MKPLSRRYFLSLMGATSAAMAMTPVTGLRAQNLPDHRFVFCYFGGGWDTLLSLDPRPWGTSYPSIQQGYDLVDWGAAGLDANQRAALRDSDGIVRPNGSNIDFGGVFSPLFTGDASRYDSLYRRGSVVRGVMMDTLTHVVGMRYFLTGHMPAGTRATGSSIPAEITAQHSVDAVPPLPNLAIDLEGYNEGPHHANPTRINGPEDLVRLLRRTQGTISGDLADQIRDHRDRSAFADPGQLNRRGLLTLVRDTQRGADELVGSGFHELFQPESLTVGDGTVGQQASDAMRKVAVAYQAITNDVAQCVSIRLVEGLDTHQGSWRSTQARDQHRGFEALAELVRGLENTPYSGGDGSSWLDHTTIFAFSEFGRTARLNNNSGRDHALVSSVYMAGAGVPQNRVVGATDDAGMNASAVDPETGEPTPVAAGGEVITPRHLAASLLKTAGLDSSPYRNMEMPCLMG